MSEFYEKICSAMNNKNYAQLTFRFGPTTAKMLNFLSLIRGRSRGEIVREAIKVYYQALSTTNIESPVSENYFQVCYPDTLDEVEMVSKPS